VTVFDGLEPTLGGVEALDGPEPADPEQAAMATIAATNGSR
jgi:hypothetical protein